MVSVQGSVETGHKDMVHDAQMDFFGTRYALFGLLIIQSCIKIGPSLMTKLPGIQMDRTS
jgi:hypothetical protein